MASYKEDRSKGIDSKWFTIMVGFLLPVMTLPSFYFSAKITMGLIMVPVVTVAVKVASKATSKVLEDEKREDQTHTMQSNKIVNLSVGLLSTFLGGLLLFSMAQTSLVTTCMFTAALALYGSFKDRQIGKNINKKLDKISNIVTDHVVNNITNFIS
ncbi:MAG: hypothetical protein LKM44_03445 [Wolbachia endosymbiont of Meromenopon meropis]|nr:hypothetical protein [Wolbachia endosymbiont of Meromenopon meropis]